MCAENLKEELSAKEKEVEALRARLAEFAAVEAEADEEVDEVFPPYKSDAHPSPAPYKSDAHLSPQPSRGAPTRGARACRRR